MVDRYKDTVFLSPHKFVGGPGTPGQFTNSIDHRINSTVYVEDRKRQRKNWTSAEIEPTTPWI